LQSDINAISKRFQSNFEATARQIDKDELRQTNGTFPRCHARNAPQFHSELRPTAFFGDVVIAERRYLIIAYNRAFVLPTERS
jgi:hypothetical protein